MGKILRQDDGFSAVEGLLILVIIGLIGFIGWYVWRAHNKTNISYNNAAKSAQLATQTNPYSGWKTQLVPSGHFTFKYKYGWYVGTGGDYTAGTAFINTEGHSVGLEGPSMIGLSSQPGDKRTDNYGAQGEIMGDQVDKTENTKLNSVAGKRYELTAVTELPRTPPVKGEKYVVYVFYTNNRTYTFYYTRQLGQPNLISDFELLVKSIKFV